MATSPKQERNGIPSLEAANPNVAQPGPMPDIPMGAATAAGMAYSETGHGVMLGGVPESTVAMEWDAGLAIIDVEGGGSA